jgi:hypothetical protein
MIQKHTVVLEPKREQKSAEPGAHIENSAAGDRNHNELQDPNK